MKSILLKQAIDRILNPLKQKKGWIECGTRISDKMDSSEEEQ